jgi:hypothetical protein
MATATLSTPIPIVDSNVAAVPAKPGRKNWLLRLIDAIAASRMRRVEQEIRRRRHLLPHAWEREAYRLGPCEDFPFAR